MAESGPGVLVAIDGAVATITLNRPQSRNAVNAAMALALDRAVTVIEEHDAVRVAIITGAGPAFCAGQASKALVAGEPEAFIGDRGWAGLTHRELRKPLIAAVEGPALGGGCELVLACHIVVASRDASFGLPEVQRGLIAGAGGAARLAHRIPRTVAMEMLLTGEPLSAERAVACGLASRLAEPGQALAEANALAVRIGRNAPLAIRDTLTVVKASLSAGESAAEEVGWRALGELLDSSDAREGARAFAERREPQWCGE